MFTCNGFLFYRLSSALAFQLECQTSPWDGQRHPIHSVSFDDECPEPPELWCPHGTDPSCTCLS